MHYLGAANSGLFARTKSEKKPKRASNKLKSIHTKLINGKIKTDSYPLHVCTKFITDLYHKKPLGSSKNLALDKRPSTKAFQKM